MEVIAPDDGPAGDAGNGGDRPATTGGGHAGDRPGNAGPSPAEDAGGPTPSAGPGGPAPEEEGEEGASGGDAPHVRPVSSSPDEGLGGGDGTSEADGAGRLLAAAMGRGRVADGDAAPDAGAGESVPTDAAGGAGDGVPPPAAATGGNAGGGGGKNGQVHVQISLTKKRKRRAGKGRAGAAPLSFGDDDEDEEEERRRRRAGLIADPLGGPPPPDAGTAEAGTEAGAEVPPAGTADGPAGNEAMPDAAIPDASAENQNGETGDAGPSGSPENGRADGEDGAPTPPSSPAGADDGEEEGPEGGALTPGALPPDRAASPMPRSESPPASPGFAVASQVRQAQVQQARQFGAGFDSATGHVGPSVAPAGDGGGIKAGTKRPAAMMSGSSLSPAAAATGPGPGVKMTIGPAPGVGHGQCHGGGSAGSLAGMRRSAAPSGGAGRISPVTAGSAAARVAKMSAELLSSRFRGSAAPQGQGMGGASASSAAGQGAGQGQGAARGRGQSAGMAAAARHEAQQRAAAAAARQQSANGAAPGQPRTAAGQGQQAANGQNAQAANGQASQPPGWRVKLYRLNPDGTWDDCGTGRVQFYLARPNGSGSSAIEGERTPDRVYRELGEPMLCVRSETPEQAAAAGGGTASPGGASRPPQQSPAQGRVLLRTRVLLTEPYQCQGGNIITWTESSAPSPSASSSAGGGGQGGGGYSVDLALSFQDNAGCREVWGSLGGVQGRAGEMLSESGGGGVGGGAAGGVGGAGNGGDGQSPRRAPLTPHNPPTTAHRDHRLHSPDHDELEDRQLSSVLAGRGLPVRPPLVSAGQVQHQPGGKEMRVHDHGAGDGGNDADDVAEMAAATAALYGNSGGPSPSSSASSGGTAPSLSLPASSSSETNGFSPLSSPRDGDAPSPGSGGIARLVPEDPGWDDVGTVGEAVVSYTFQPAQREELTLFLSDNECEYLCRLLRLGMSGYEAKNNPRRSTGGRSASGAGDGAAEAGGGDDADGAGVSAAPGASSPPSPPGDAGVGDSDTDDDLPGPMPSAPGTPSAPPGTPDRKETTVPSASQLSDLASTFKSILLLNDPEIIECVCLDPSSFRSLCAVMEYDPDLARKGDHLSYLSDRARFRTVLPMSDGELVTNVHRLFRVNYLRDVVLRPTMDESSLSTLSSLASFLMCDIVKAVVTAPEGPGEQQEGQPSQESHGEQPSQQSSGEQSDEGASASAAPPPPNAGAGGEAQQQRQQAAEDDGDGGERDSYLVRVIRLLANEIQAIRRINCGDASPLEEGGRPAPSSPAGADPAPAPAADGSECGGGEDAGGGDDDDFGMWRQHVSPQDASLPSRLERRRGCLAFLVELFTMARTSLAAHERDDFVEATVTLSVTLREDRPGDDGGDDEDGGGGARGGRAGLGRWTSDHPGQHHAPGLALAQPDACYTNLISVLASVLGDTSTSAAERGHALEVLSEVTGHDTSLVRRYCQEFSEVTAINAREARIEVEEVTGSAVATSSGGTAGGVGVVPGGGGGPGRPGEDASVLLRPAPADGGRGDVLLSPMPDDLLDGLLYVMATSSDAGLLLQSAEVLRTLLDPDGGDGPGPSGLGGAGLGGFGLLDTVDSPGSFGSDPTGLNDFLALFYDRYVHWLAAPVRSYAVPSGRRADRGPRCLARERVLPLVSGDAHRRAAVQIRILDGRSCRRAGGGGPPPPPPPGYAEVPPSPVRSYFVLNALAFCVGSHAHKMKFFLIRERLLGSALGVLGAPAPPPAEGGGVRCMKLAALKLLRAVISVKDEFYHRHIIQFNLFAPVFDLFRSMMPVGSNLISSAILELCDFISSEKIKSLLDYIVTKHMTKPSGPGGDAQRHHKSLEELARPAFPTFDNLRRAYEVVNNIDRGATGEGGSNPSGAAGNDRVVLNEKALEDQRKFRQADEEDSYFNDDDDDENSEPQPPSAEHKTDIESLMEDVDSLHD